MEKARQIKVVEVSPATHRRLLIEAATRGMKAWRLADELLARALAELPQLQQHPASIDVSPVSPDTGCASN